MLTVKWDNAPVMSRQSQRRSPTPYLRGTVGAAGPGLESLIGSRVLAWGDTDAIGDYQGKVTEIAADLRDKITVEDTNQESVVLANIRLTREFTADEAAKFQGIMMLAQMQNLDKRGSREIRRPTDPGQVERRLAGDLGSTSAQAVAGQALPGGEEAKNALEAEGGVKF